MLVAALIHSRGWAVAIVVYVAVLVAVRVVSYLTSKKHNVNLDVRVGVNEPHVVHLYFDAYRARIRIAVDGVPVEVTGVPVPKWGPTLQRQYKVHVGRTEKHTVTFVKTHKLPLATMRSQTIVADIDGTEVPVEATQ